MINLSETGKGKLKHNKDSRNLQNHCHCKMRKNVKLFPDLVDLHIKINLQHFLMDFKRTQNLTM